METVDEAVRAFFDARKPRKHSPHTLAAYRADIDAVCAALRDVTGTSVVTLGDLTLANLRRAFSEISDHSSAATLARRWSTWNQLLSFLVAEELLTGNPMANIDKPKVPRSLPKSIEGDDSVERLLTIAAAGRPRARNPWPERDLAVVVILLTCGLRLSELLSLSVDSFDVASADRRLKIRGKGAKERALPVEPEVETVVADYLRSRLARFGRWEPGAPLLLDDRGGPLNRWAVQYLVESLYREAGIRARVPAGALVHALRHTFATGIASQGATGTELRELLGHESLATTQRYIDASAREVRAAARSNPVYHHLRPSER